MAGVRARERDYYFLREADAAEEPRRFGGYDVTSVRADFPALEQKINGHPLVFLDNGATTIKPRAMIERTTRFYAIESSNIQRAAHTMAKRATELYEGARARVARFIGAAEANEIIFVRGATEAINYAAEAYVRPRLQPGDEVLVAEMEHHSNFVPWQRMCKQTGATLNIAPINDDGDLILEEFAARLGPRTRIAAVAHVSNVLGTVNPIAQLAAIAHAHGVPLLVDGAQGVPHAPVNVQAMGCDFYALSGHKVYGPTGIGALYVRQAILADLEPYQVGGGMVHEVTREHTIYAPQPNRFEAGTPNLAGAIGLGASLDYLDRIGFAAALEHEAALVAHFKARLAEIPGARLIGNPREHASILSILIDGVPIDLAGRVLDASGIEVRVGPHCAQPLMQRLGLEGTIRIAVGVYNTVEELNLVADILHRLAKTRPG